MSLSNGFRRIADLIDEIEADDVEVRDAAIPTDQRAFRDGKVEVTLDVALPIGDEESQTTEESDGETTTGATTGATISGTLSKPDGSNGNEHREDGDAAASANGRDAAKSSGGQENDNVETESVGTQNSDSESSDEDVVADTESNPAGPGTVTCPEPGCDETFESEPGMKIHRTKIHRRSQESTTNDGPPAYRDPEALRSAYEAHDSFPAMRDALDVDVSAQTVRRHMIQHGIHDPTADGTEGQAAADQQANGTEEASDGERPEEESQEAIPADTPLTESLPADVTAPPGVTFAELREGVKTADTLYDIQQQFDLDRKQARDLLGSLDLLELVHGRVATKHEREELKAEIDSRIRHSIDEKGTSA